MISFFVPGKPQPGGSKRAFVIRTRTGGYRANVTDDCKRNGAWRASVSLFATRAHEKRAPLEGPLSLSVVFVVQRPNGHFGSGRNAGRLKPGAPPFPTVKPDATKLLRSTEDALTGILWRDDAQIVSQRVAKVYADERYPTPGAHIVVEQIADAVAPALRRTLASDRPADLPDDRPAFPVAV